jgi:hypothetical protein
MATDLPVRLQNNIFEGFDYISLVLYKHVFVGESNSWVYYIRSCLLLMAWRSRNQISQYSKLPESLTFDRSFSNINTLVMFVVNTYIQNDF